MEPFYQAALTVLFLAACWLGADVLFDRWTSEPDYCPRLYKGYACHRESNDGCDHSSRAWAMLGIDLEQLTEQPYKSQGKGYWNE